ncbi:MAG: cation transporter [Bacteroidetes bacterium]|nr:cation transporter [Bacteroidota bacterium]MBU1114157.1 cation transporter [Bacteroidota bacterium]MBU1800113.1 cation transporter [Bacteroidota bacterium]
MKEKLFLIEGMTCSHCKMTVETELKNAGIKNFTVAIGSVKVESLSTDDEIKVEKAIESAGYKVIK